jgi:hypothetical protein
MFNSYIKVLCREKSFKYRWKRWWICKSKYSFKFFRSFCASTTNRCSQNINFKRIYWRWFF